MKLKLACLFTILSVGVHLYLTNHFHTVQMGSADGKSTCNISDTFNCDAVAASDYSTIAGIPIAAFGVTTNLVILILLGLVLLRLTEIPEKALRAAFWLSAFSLLASAVMGVISLTQLTTYCLYCIVLYIFSVFIFFLIRGSAKKLEFKLGLSELMNDIKSYIKAPVWPVVLALSIPAFAFFINKGIEGNNIEGSSKDFERLVSSSIQDWQNGTVHKFDTPASLIKGKDSASAKITVVEFADFRCGHCQKASGPLSTFANSHSDVQLHFYNFPLDGACNEKIPNSNGVSCRLAKAVHCGNAQDFGWAFHDVIFANQKSFFTVGSSDGVDKKLKSLITEFSPDWTKLSTCMDSAETHQAIKKQAELGVRVGVQGTPKIYMNGKALPAGQFLPVLKKARSIVLGN